jgi:hypothetical protein
MWARRLLIGAGLAASSLFIVPTVAGAADCGSMTGVGCSTTPSIAGTSTSPAPTAALPNTGSGSSGSTAGTSTNPGTGSSSLPFTGADIGELAVIGAGAVVAGTVLIRRRRQPAL